VLSLGVIVGAKDSQANPNEADRSGKKKIQTRITHNDGASSSYYNFHWLSPALGGSWKPLNPPAQDSLGQEYDCQSTVSSAWTPQLRTDGA
jgi:hypothetical protein